MRWIPFPAEELRVHGLPWFPENAPDLWRLPKRADKVVRPPVWQRARFPGGGRIRFRTNTSRLAIRVSASQLTERSSMTAFGCRGLDAYVNGQFWRPVAITAPGESEKEVFAEVGTDAKTIDLYLPLFQECRLLSIGVDADAEVQPPPAFARERPLVLYGSSVAQGTCASRPGMTYEAILARRLGVDFVNLGFGGNGKAEPEVVRLVAELDACCFLFDLGKSFGRQSAEVYGAMLDAIRAAHPTTPLVCITPIFSTQESFHPEYRDYSEGIRRVMRQAASDRQGRGDRRLHLVEGLQLLGAADADGLQETLHPTDLGYERIATRLLPTLGRALAL